MYTLSAVPCRACDIYKRGVMHRKISDTTPECRRYPAKLPQHSTYGPHWQALLRSLKGAGPMGMC